MDVCKIYLWRKFPVPSDLLKIDERVRPSPLLLHVHRSSKEENTVFCAYVQRCCTLVKPLCKMECILVMQGARNRLTICCEYSVCIIHSSKSPGITDLKGRI